MYIRGGEICVAGINRNIVPLFLVTSVVDVGKRFAINERPLTNVRYTVGDNNRFKPAAIYERTRINTSYAIVIDLF